MILLHIRFDVGDQVDDEIDWTCSTCWREEKFLQGIGCKM